MKVIGLTGGIGAGKSAVAERLARRGAVVIDADQIVRELQAPGQPVLAAIVDRFGPAVLARDGTLDRGSLASIVFADGRSRRDLEAIVHPAVRAEIARRLDEARDMDAVIVLDIPLLVEAAGAYPVDAVVVVDAPESVVMDRLVARGLSENDARARMEAQLSRSARVEAADRVLVNEGSMADLDAAVESLWRWIAALDVKPRR